MTTLIATAIPATVVSAPTAMTATVPATVVSAATAMAAIPAVPSAVPATTILGEGRGKACWMLRSDCERAGKTQGKGEEKRGRLGRRTQRCLQL